MWPPRTNRPGRRACVLAAGLVAAVLVAIPSQAQSKPTPQAQSKSRAQPAKPAPAKGPGVFPLDVLWTLALDDSDTPAELSERGPACPPAYDGWTMYVALKSGHLAAVSLGTGSVRWTTAVTAVRAVAATGGLVLTVGERVVTARHGSDGTPAWEVRFGTNVSPDVRADHDWVIAGTDDGGLTAIRASDGATVWQVNVGAKLSGVPAIAGEGLYLPLENNQVRRVAITSGETVWTRDLLERPRIVLALDDRVFVATEGRYLYALDPHNAGKAVPWRKRTPEVSGTPAASEKWLFFLTLDNVLQAVRRSDGDLEWEHVMEHRTLFGPVLEGSLLLASGISDAIIGVSAASGKTTGTFEAPREFAAPLHVIPGVIDRDLLIVGISPEGTVLAIRSASMAMEPFVAAPQWPADMPVMVRWK